jgi:RNA polymerase sigma factor (sigma-70 family)
MTIAHRKAIDHARGRARRAVPAAEAELLAGSGDRRPGGATGAADSAAADPATGIGHEPLWDHVAALPPKQRTAIALRYLADLTHAEIGEVMGTSADAARRNVHEGLNRLRKEDLG